MSRSNKNVLILILFLNISGVFLNCLFYKSLEPLLVLIFFHAVSLFVLFFGFYETKIFYLNFSLGVFLSGISATYIFLLKDDSQLSNDAGNFFALASSVSEGYTLNEIMVYTDGSGAVIVWRNVYKFFALFGFAKERYIGIFVNSFIVATSGVLFVRALKIIYRRNELLNNGIFYYTICGILWLFSSVHVRDAFVFFNFNILIFVWIRFINQNSILNAFGLFFVSVLSIGTFTVLRGEYFLIPLALLFSWILSLVFTIKTKLLRIFVPFLLAIVFLMILSFVNVESIFNDFVRRSQGYADSAFSESQSSLGFRLIINQPAVIRIFFGTFYLFIFPIPLWIGFLSTSVISLYKSINAIYFIGTFPIFILILRNLDYYKSKIDLRYFYFILISFLGLSFSVALTSLEIRHFGSFIILYILLITSYEHRLNVERLLFMGYFRAYVLLILFLHLLWTILKLLI